jgi:hypothetical protein
VRHYATDKDFVFRSVPTDSVSHVCRLAVFFTLAGYKPGMVPDWSKWLDKIVRLWRNMVDNLSIQGRKLDHFARVRNCWPAKVLVKNEGPIHCCSHDSFCPWCYIRAIEQIIRNGLERFRPGNGIFSAVRYDYVPYGQFAPGQLREELQERREYCNTLCLGNERHCDGSFYLVTIEPSTNKKHPDCWRIGMRICAFTKPGKKFLCVPRNWTVLYEANPTVQDLYAGLSMALRYSAGLLKGDAAKVVEALEARKKLRLMGRNGCFLKPRGSAFPRLATKTTGATNAV